MAKPTSEQVQDQYDKFWEALGSQTQEACDACMAETAKHFALSVSETEDLLNPPEEGLSCEEIQAKERFFGC